MFVIGIDILYDPVEAAKKKSGEHCRKYYAQYLSQIFKKLNINE